MQKAIFSVLCIILNFSILQAQQFEQYGLEREAITALASYGGALFAGTDGDGLFVRRHPDSSWTFMGLTGVSIRSIYPHDVGPLGWGITVGTQPTQSPGDSALTYCWTSYEPRWVVSDSGLDRNEVFRILSIDGFPDPKI